MPSRACSLEFTMLSSDVPGENSWPRDMVIRVDQPASLLFLLFVRSAWQLDESGVPPLDSVPAAGSTVPPAGLDRDEVNGHWKADWARAFESVVPPRGPLRRPDAATLRLLDADLDADELFRAVSVQEYWRQGLDHDAETAWEQSMWPAPPPPGGLGPEADAAEWLVGVWRSGVRSIIELPFAGYYVKRVDREHVVVSRATRSDPQLYSLALSTL